MKDKTFKIGNKMLSFFILQSPQDKKNLRNLSDFWFYKRCAITDKKFSAIIAKRYN
jgi:hypothetical protein